MNRIRLFHYELASMRVYETTLPSGTVTFKMWRSRVKGNAPFINSRMPNPEDWVSQYVPDPDPKLIGIRHFRVDVLEGPMDPKWEKPDWDNYARWQRENRVRSA